MESLSVTSPTIIVLPKFCKVEAGFDVRDDLDGIGWHALPLTTALSHIIVGSAGATIGTALIVDRRQLSTELLPYKTRSFNPGPQFFRHGSLSWFLVNPGVLFPSIRHPRSMSSTQHLSPVISRDAQRRF